MSRTSRNAIPRKNSVTRQSRANHIQLEILAKKFRDAISQANYELGCELAAQALLVIPGNMLILSDYALCLMRTERHEQSFTIYKSIFEAPEEKQKKASDTWLDGLVEVCGYLQRTEDVRRYGRMALERAAARHSNHPRWPLGSAPPKFDTTKPEQNVIAYSLYGANPKYCEGAVMNARVITELFPGWACRIYLNSSVPQHVQQRLKTSGAQVINMDNDLGRTITPTMWRFLVMDDPQVHRYLIRDADSLLCEKEVNAVAQWVDSPHWYHHMRDYFTHTELILAGMWGGCNGMLPPMTPIMRTYIQNHTGTARFTDQHFLREILWPTVNQSLLSHDEIFGFYNSQPFPPHKPIRWKTDKFHIGSNTSTEKLTGHAGTTAEATQLIKFKTELEEYEYEVPVVNGQWSLELPFFLASAFSAGDLKVQPG